MTLSDMVGAPHEVLACTWRRPGLFIKVRLLIQPVRHPASADRDAGDALIAARPSQMCRRARARRGPREARQDQQRACVPRPSSPGVGPNCGCRRCGRSGSSAAVGCRAFQPAREPDGVCRHPTDAQRNGFAVTPTGSAGSMNPAAAPDAGVEDSAGPAETRHGGSPSAISARPPPPML